MSSYRFKTEEELFADYGESWKLKGSIFLECMRPLMGKSLSFRDTLQYKKAMRIKQNKDNPEGYHGFMLKSNYKYGGFNFKGWAMDETGIIEIKE